MIEKPKTSPRAIRVEESTIRLVDNMGYYNLMIAKVLGEGAQYKPAMEFARSRGGENGEPTEADIIAIKSTAKRALGKFFSEDDEYNNFAFLKDKSRYWTDNPSSFLNVTGKGCWDEAGVGIGDADIPARWVLWKEPSQPSIYAMILEDAKEMWLEELKEDLASGQMLEQELRKEAADKVSAAEEQKTKNAMISETIAISKTFVKDKKGRAAKLLRNE